MSLFAVTWSLRIADILPPIVRDRTFIEQAVTNGSEFKAGLPLPMYLEFIIASSKGHWKEKSSIGVGMWLWIQSTASPQQLKREIIQQLTNDIFTNPFVDVSAFPTVIVNDLKFEPNG